MTANRYFLCSRLRPPLEFDIGNERPADDAEIAYFIRAFQTLERDYGLRGKLVCFAWSSLVRLPRLGPDVVAVIYGDEHCRIPAYVTKVGAVIKCHGFFPNFVPRRRPLRLLQIELVEFLRNLVLWLPTGWRWLLRGGLPAGCHLVPLGWGLPTEVSPRPFDERPHIVSFMGSVGQPQTGKWLRALLGTPKSYCRAALMPVLEGLRRRYGEHAVRLNVTTGFQDSIRNAGQTYFDALAHTKICVAPRGTAHETLRIYEGLRFGCIVIADRLPRHDFYRDTPIIQIGDWHELPDLIEQLLGDPVRMRELHRRSVAYWRDVLSESALARRCAADLGLRASEHADAMACGA